MDASGPTPGRPPEGAERIGARHRAVLLAEASGWLGVRAGATIVDGTVGAGGHATAIAEALGPKGRLIGLDRDPMMLRLAAVRLGVAVPERDSAGGPAGSTAERSSVVAGPAGCRIDLVHASYADLRQVLNELGIDRVDGVLVDLGVSSDQLADESRGFSFDSTGPLDMRFDPDEGVPASQLVNRLSERELADLLYRYGEERFSRRIARRIVEHRRREPITRADQLAELVRRAVPRPSRRRGAPGPRIDAATRVFQALRIAVNGELAALESLMATLPDCLVPGGRAVIISFHSLEDRIVKQAFRNRDVWKVLTRKPVRPTPDEARANPRARSAKLRAAERVDGGE